MADPAGPKKPEVKYDYPGHEADDAAVKKVEDALASRFNDSYKEGLANSAKDAPIKEEEAHAKIDKAKQDAKQEEINNPDKVAKEKQESPPPPMQVSSMKPNVQQHNPTTSGPKTAKGGAAAPPPKAPGKAGPPSAKGAGAVPAAPQPIVVAAAATGDAQLDTFLNGYSPKAKEPTERLSKIKEMAEVAKGFDGKVENMIATGSGAFEGPKNAAINFLGKKEFNQTFGENPYGKVKDKLSGIMSGISRVQGFVSIVGNICSKLGLILTVLGLFGFIFPPIGAAIQAVARVLNVVGLICDALGLILSGVLVGLNGVVLARTIGKGGSNEEKAAVAEMMMGEANAAGGHIMNLALAYGGKFMSGIKNASKGVIANLMKRFKGVVGKFASKTLGPVANWAKKIGYKFGFGLEKAAKATPGFASKAATKVGQWGKAAWNAPGKALEKIRETKFVKGINESAKMKGLERWSAKVNNSTFARLDGEGVEELGKKAGEKVFTKGLETRMEASAQMEAREAFEAAEKNSIKDAGNKERAQIEREIKAQREQGNKLYNESTSGPNLDEGKAVKSREMYEQADKLAANEEKAVAKAEQKAAKEGEKEWSSEQTKQQAEKKEEAAKSKREDKNKEDWKEDPQKFQDKTERMEKELHDKERLIENPVAKESRKEKARQEAEELRKKIEERKATSQVVGGKEEPKGPENLYGAYKEGKEAVEHIQGKDDKVKEKDEAKNKWIEKDEGLDKKEKIETEERHEKIEHWEAHKSPESTTSQQVEGMLSGLDEELGLEPAGDHDEEHHDDPGAGDEHHEGDANDEQKADHQDPNAAAAHAAPPKEEKKEEPKHEEKKDEAPKDAETPELAYWPKLTEEFTKSAAELGRMKKIAYGFRKAQAEAKKKAIEAATTFNKQGEDASKKQQHAGEHGKALHAGVDEMKGNAGAADAGGAKAGAGQAKQNEGQSSAGGSAQPGPDPGEKPGLLHPIKRIWWYVKKWVSDKAAAVFGWIQEKIASMVLKVVCGISMGDLKAYTSALHHRMDYSKLVGTQGVEKANATMKKSLEDKGKTKTYEQQALDDAAECDQNMADADAFVKEVEDNERDLVAEQAKAKQFLDQLHGAVKAEKARKEQEAQQKAAEQAQQKAAAQNGGPGAPAGPVSVPKAPASQEKDAKGKGKKKQEPKPLNPASVSKVKNAADFVANQARLVIDQLTSSKQEQRSRLQAKLEEKGILKRLTFNTSHVGDKVLADAKTSANEIATSLPTYSPTAAADLQRQAGQVKGKAKQVDEFAHIAHENLNKAFKESYEALAKH